MLHLVHHERLTIEAMIRALADTFARNATMLITIQDQEWLPTQESAQHDPGLTGQTAFTIVQADLE